MDPTVVAAWIAAGVSALTLAGTLAAQYLGYRATSRDAEKTAEEERKAAEEQRKQLDQTRAEQRDQLDRTLKAQSDQLEVTFGDAVFSGGLVDFSQASDWSVPPVFPWAGAPRGRDASRDGGSIQGVTARAPRPRDSWQVLRDLL